MGLWKTGVVHGTDTSSTTSISPSNLPNPQTDSLPITPTKPKPPGWGDSGGGGGSSGETVSYSAPIQVSIPKPEPTPVQIKMPERKSDKPIYRRLIEKKSRYEELLELKRKKKTSFSFGRKQKVRVAPLIKAPRLKKLNPYTFRPYLIRDSFLFKPKIKRRKR